MRRFLSGLAIICALVAPAIAAERVEVRVAAAANLKAVLGEIVTLYKEQADVALVIVSGSTGQLAAQIMNGAPFDVFLAADQARPARLAAAGFAAPGRAPQTYAIGALALFGPSAPRPLSENSLRRSALRRLAIANPKTAPYGAAAQAYLRRIGVWEALQGRVAYAQSVAGAHAAVRSGAAELGLVALSTLKAADTPSEAIWTPPSDAYPEMRQDLLVLERASDNAAAADFAAFMFTPQARDVLSVYGYRFE